LISEIILAKDDALTSTVKRDQLIQLSSAEGRIVSTKKSTFQQEFLISTVLKFSLNSGAALSFRTVRISILYPSHEVYELRTNERGEVEIPLKLIYNLYDQCFFV